MTQMINPQKLKAAAEHLEWVLSQYPGIRSIQSLLESLRPLIEAAETGSILEAIDQMDIPGAYNLADGKYMQYKVPSVGEAYVRFSIELRGGVTEQEKRIINSIPPPTSEVTT